MLLKRKNLFTTEAKGAQRVFMYKTDLFVEITIIDTQNAFLKIQQNYFLCVLRASVVNIF